jgi:polyhydroxybutyrate depolymerase
VRRATVLGLAGLAFAVCLPAAAPASARTARAAGSQHLTVDGIVRTYRVHLPNGSVSPSPVPLVVVLHGAGATAREVERRYHWDPRADRAGFVVAYPQAIDRRWNDGASANAPDDVGFLAALLDTLEARYAIDRARVYVTGISNGGIMTYRAACALGDRLAAIGPVAAWFPDCLPAAPVSVIHIHGILDGQLPYLGGSGYPAVEVGLAAWRAVDACPAAPGTTGGAEVTRRAWAPCADGTGVTLVTLAHGRHEWPSAIPKPGNDPVSRALDATRTIWTFFLAHTR